MGDVITCTLGSRLAAHKHPYSVTSSESLFLDSTAKMEQEVHNQSIAYIPYSTLADSPHTL